MGRPKSQMTDEQFELIVSWADAEFKRRTDEIDAGSPWIDEIYRLPRADIRAYAESIGVKLTIMDEIEIATTLQRRSKS